MRRPLLPRRWALALAGAVAFACVTDTTVGPEVIASITVVPASGDVAVGATLQLTAVVRDSNGVPYLGIPATWSSSDDAVATVSEAGLVTGVALGPVMITAEIDGLTSMAMLNTVPPPAIALAPAALVFDGFASGPDPAPQTVAVTNGGGATLSGLSVGAVTYGAGATGWLTAGLDVGTAPAILTISASPSGLAVGSYTATVPVTAVVASNSPQSVTVTFNVTVDAASQMALDTGDAQTAAVNTAVPVAPAVILRDQFGNPVPGDTVIFTVTAGGGTITGDTAISNASGVAAAGSWTLGTVAGPNILEASAAGLAGSPVTFTATAVAGAAAQIAASTGDGQSATVGSPVSVAPVVLVTDQFGNAVAGVPVTFAIGLGGGSVTGGAATTDANGLAAVTMWTLGTTSGTNTLTATATGLAGSPVTFTATATPAPASQIAASAGDGQSAAVGSDVATPPVVLVTDQFGNPVAGVLVTFAVGSGGGSLTGGSPTTDAAGLAAVGSWTLGTNTGPNTLTATAPGLSGSPVTFTATATAGAATQITLSAGNGQTATVNTAVGVDPAVLVRDQFNNPVQGVAVTFAVTGGGGSVAGGAATTDASGIATVTSWTLGTVAGANTLTATATGLTGSPVTFTATGTADVATQIALSAGDGQSATVGTAVAVDPAVLVQDQYGNAVAGVTVTFAVTGGGGSVGGTNPVATNASGIAAIGSWTLGTVAGTNNNTLTATASGLAGSPIGFTATATAGAATQIALNAGDNQSAAVNTTVPIAPSVLVRDQFNNPVAGVPVTFTVTAGGGNVAGGNALTNASGIAQVTSWTLGSSAGANTLTATAAGLAGSPVTFNATAFAGSATTIALNGGNSQTDTAGAALPVLYSVLVTDAVGNPVQNVPVAWAVGSGGGSILPATSNTDVNGIASATRTLGTTAGAQTATAAVGGLAGSPITFSATATAATATQIALNAGDNQTATVNTAVAIAPSVLVRDAFNNAVAGAAVTFAVTGGGGNVSGGAATTNASGIATVGSWTLGTGAGTNNNTLTATAAGLAGSPVGFTASATAGAATQVSLQAGDNQTATVNTAVAIDPAVLVRDQYNNPVQGVVVTFAVTGGGGSLTGATPATDASGIATLGAWTLGTAAGTNNNTLTATAAGLSGSPVPFTASATAGAATQIAVNAGNNQSAQVNTAVPIAPSVFVGDAFGNAVAGVSVTFAVTSGGGVVDPITALTTNAAGVAQVTSWTLGGVVGVNTLTATSTPALSGSPVTFTANGFSGAATTMALSAGNAQTDTVGATLPILYAVLVTDGTNPVPGVPVSWAVPGGQGSITPASSNTDVNGIATASRTLGTTAGTQTATASVGGLTGSPVNFTATATAGAATQIAVNAGSGQSATVGSAVAIDPSVVVRDQFGNAVAGASVTFAVTGGGGTVDPTTAILTDAAGIATVNSWTLGNTAGANTLGATSAGLAGSPVTFTATGTADAATQMALNLGNNQSATVNTAVAVDPSVLVRDQFNNPVQGVSVTFAVGLGGGNVAGGNATTDASGIATVTSWTLGTGAGVGNNTLTATNGALAGSPVTFTATATADVPQTIALSAGDGQSATVNTAVAIDPAVLVTDQFGNPVAGVDVTFAVQNGGGTVDPVAAVPTGANGIATVTSWTLGTLAGTNNNTLTANASGVAGTVTFTASAVAGAAQTIVLQAGAIQTATVNSAVATAPSVLVRDQFNNPVPGFSVTFTITQGGGTLDPVSGGSVLTDANGIAAVNSWTLGTTAGTLNNTLEATAALSGSPVVFQATAEPGAAATLAINAGAGQSATVNTAVAIDPAVLVTDSFGNPVPNVLVTFTPDPGDGSVTGSPATSDANGIAAVTSWTLGTLAGPDSLTASSGALTPVRFGATGTADVAFQIAVSDGNGQSATVNTAVAVDPAVVVTDQFGNPVAGHSVTFAVTSGAGTVDPVTALFTDAGGIATVTSWTLGTTAGANSLTATPSPALSGGPVGFTATGTAGAATQMSLNAGNGQSATVNTAVAVDPSVLVRDQFNNPVQGVSITFTITGGAGTLSPASPALIQTDASGIAAVTSWTLGTQAGANTLSATNGSLSGSPVNFTATGTAGAVSASQSLVADNQVSIVACSVSCTVAGGTADSITVTARDQFANPINGASVTVNVTGTNNTFSLPQSGTTNASGVFVTRFNSTTAQAKTISAVINAVAITQTAAVTVNPGAPNATFSSLIESNDPIIACASSCSTGAGTASSLVVTARDQFNNAISGASVTVSVTSGTSNYLGGVFQSSINGVTNVSGQYTVLYNSTLAQAKSLNAAITFGSLINEVTSLTVNPAGAANLTLNLGNNQTARVGSPVATDPSVLVEDAFGNNISGASVTFLILEGGGSIVGSPATTNASGIATLTSWSVGATGTEGAEGSGTFAGQFENRLRARITGVDSVEYSAHGFYTWSGDLPSVVGSTSACAGCHGWSRNPNNFVGVAASLGSCPGWTIGVAGSATNSLIYRKTAGTTVGGAPPCGSTMPNSSGLTAAQRTILRAWLNDGALNN